MRFWKHRNTRLIAAGCLAVVVCYTLLDLYWPGRQRLNEFDPDEVARLDTEMWRSYYDRRQFLMFFQLGELMRSQYGMMPIRSTVTSYHAAKAAFVFKDGKKREDYEQALPNLESFFSSIASRTDQRVDVRSCAVTELEWWIVHRERANHAPGELARSLAIAASTFYALQAERFEQYGRYRAEAMAIRDSRAEAGGVSEEDWARIGGLLQQSWRSLHAAVNE